MKIIKSLSDIEGLPFCPEAILAIRILTNLLNEIEDECSIASYGTIYIIESENDLDNYEGMELSSPVSERMFEYVSIEDGCVDVCVVINNDYAINIIGKYEIFKKRGLLYEN